ncbi:hypothetical protein CVT24_009072 [Panaeolus cyanescens]|uniref:pyranose dehydrogenase (acceptor) n=1 Tax=Panaeolus cyanescens TaxID=181874 RepID=A0A409WEK4_9AGAR|nr:hypothetical protein CVT24_009072 [Panaeolus cyanescens]
MRLHTRAALVLAIALLQGNQISLAVPIHDDVGEIDKLKFDFIVVGGGTAGNVIANRLTESSKYSVLVIEAGPSHEGVLNTQVPFFAINNWFTQYDWNYTTVPQPGLAGQQKIIPRGHILGGSSSINFLMYTRSTQEDYDRMANLTGDKGWSWKGLLPYFKKNERLVLPADGHNVSDQFDPALHGRKGPLAVSPPPFKTSIDDMVVTATHQLGGDFSYVRDYNDGKSLGIGHLQVTVDEKGRRASSATAYLAPKYLRRPNLHVLVNAQVSRLIQTKPKPHHDKGDDDDDKKPSGKSPTFLTVEFRHQSRKGLVTLTAKHEIILSAGAIGTPHILLNSGIGPAKTLKQVGVHPIVDLPDVGQNLADHCAIANPFVALKNDTFEDVRTPAGTAHWLSVWEKTGSGRLANTLASFVGFHRLNGTDAPSPDPAPGPHTPHFEHLIANGLIVPNAFVPQGQHIISVATAINSPVSRGSISINSTNPFAPPLIDLGLLASNVDRVIMRAALRHAFQFLEAPVWKGYADGGAGDLKGKTTDDELDEYINAEAGTFFHPTGSASMSPRNAKWGVTDPDLRVKKVKGLRVVDASIFPRIPSGHTQAAVYAIAERAADVIKADYNYN